MADLGVSVAAGATSSGVNLEMAGGAIAGTVTAAATGLPVEGVTVSLFDRVTRLVAGRTTTDASGDYEIGGLSVADAPEYAATFDAPPAANLLPHKTNTVAVVVSAGHHLTATTTTLNVALLAGGKIEGQITNRAAEPVGAGVDVVARGSAGRGTAVTNSSGDYTITGLPSGEYTVTAGGE